MEICKPLALGMKDQAFPEGQLPQMPTGLFQIMPTTGLHPCTPSFPHAAPFSPLPSFCLKPSGFAWTEKIIFETSVRQLSSC